MELPTEPIYLDRDQCEHFGVEYVPKDTTIDIAADTVLRSKASGYDEHHRAILKPLGERTLQLRGTGHGWFEITAVL